MHFSKVNKRTLYRILNGSWIPSRRILYCVVNTVTVCDDYVTAPPFKSGRIIALQFS